MCPTNPAGITNINISVDRETGSLTVETETCVIAYEFGDNPFTYRENVADCLLAFDSSGVPAAAKPEEWISERNTAALCCLTTSTLRRYRRDGKGPRRYKPMSDTRGVYPLSEVLKWVEQRKKRGEKCKDERRRK